MDKRAVSDPSCHEMVVECSRYISAVSVCRLSTFRHVAIPYLTLLLALPFQLGRVVVASAELKLLVSVLLAVTMCEQIDLYQRQSRNGHKLGRMSMLRYCLCIHLKHTPSSLTPP